LDRVIFRPSPIHGLGIFAARDFKAGERILRRDDSRLVTSEDPLREGELESHCDWIADGRVVYVQEPERYTNHSCDPNVYVEVVGEDRYFTARREIGVGEEITEDYTIDMVGGTPWDCNCGAARCRGTVQGEFFRQPKEIQIEYLPYLSPWFRERSRKEVEGLEREAAARERADTG
jgi:SET domain-containing protein